MGVKMKQAHYNEQKINLKEYKEGMKGSLKCTSCDVPVIYVGDHNREINRKLVFIAAHFRLKVKVEHKPSCGYLTSNQIELIFAESSDIHELFSRKDGGYILRLLFITDSGQKSPVKKPTKSNDVDNDKKPTLNYVNKGNLNAYISSMRRIIKLRNSLEENGEIKSLLELSFYNSDTRKYDKVKWNDFFVENNKDSYSNAYDIIANKDQHPICFSGVINKIEKPTEKFNSYKITMKNIKIEKNKFFSLSISFKSEDIYNKFKDEIGKGILVYSDRNRCRIRSLETVEFFNIYASISNAKQIIILD